MSDRKAKRILLDWNHRTGGGRAVILGNHPKESRPWPKGRWISVHLSSRRLAARGLLLRPELRRWLQRWVRRSGVAVRRLEIQAQGISFSMKVREPAHGAQFLRACAGLIARRAWGAERGRPRASRLSLWDRRPLTMKEPEPPWKYQVFEFYFSLLRWARAAEMPVLNSG